MSAAAAAVVALVLVVGAAVPDLAEFVDGFVARRRRARAAVGATRSFRATALPVGTAIRRDEAELTTRCEHGVHSADCPEECEGPPADEHADLFVGEPVATR